MPKKYRSDAMAAIHETMEALHEVGAVDRQTMREFDETCLTPIEVMLPEQIKALRIREHISQPVFARYLNVSKNLVSDWERGIKKPGGPALRLLTVIQHKGLMSIACSNASVIPAPSNVMPVSLNRHRWIIELSSLAY
jgi:putative transcriptional regulator